MKSGFFGIISIFSPLEKCFTHAYPDDFSLAYFSELGNSRLYLLNSNTY